MKDGRRSTQSQILLVEHLKRLFRPVDRDVFVRDLNRQLGTPSHWLPVDSCKKKGQRGALAAVCTPTLKSASKKHQNCSPTSLSTAYGTLKVIKRTVYMCVSFLPQAKIFPQSLVRNLKHEQATREFSRKFAKSSNQPRFQHSPRYLNYPSI